MYSVRIGVLKVEGLGPTQLITRWVVLSASTIGKRLLGITAVHPRLLSL